MQLKGEKGQAILLVVVAVALILAGAAGLAIDAGQLYGHMQMAQPTADSAAMAAAMSIYGKTNTGTNAFGDATFTCTNGTDARTPCVYARNNGFGLTNSSDIVAVSFPASVPGVSLSSAFAANAVQVDVTRNVSTTFMRFFGTSTSRIHAQATAGIVQVVSPVPILVLDLTGKPSFTMKGTPNITICGGPQRSIQVNSSDPGALDVQGSAKVDLSKAGPNDDGTCSANGTGGDFAVWGGPSSTPSFLTPFGSNEHYVQPAAAQQDPLGNVTAPTKPGTNGTVTAGISAGTGDCPATASKGCTIYTPGYYASFTPVKNTTGIFQPGIYYIDGGQFGNDANGNMIMCTTCTPDTSGCCSNNGMLVYLTKNVTNVNLAVNNSTATLKGADQGGTYLGMLIFMARNAKDIGPGFGGGGSLILTGTIYMPTQTLNLSGNSGNATVLKGEIIVNDLVMGGTGGIKMQLDSDFKLTINQVALIK
jgi:hypothetical protein